MDLHLSAPPHLFWAIGPEKGFFADLHEKLQILAQGAQPTQSTAKLCKHGTWWWCAHARTLGRGGSRSGWIPAEGDVRPGTKAEGGAVILITGVIVIQSL